jgi:hypothetical protein
LPKQAAKLFEKGRDLVKEAKGLKWIAEGVTGVPKAAR